MKKLLVIPWNKEQITNTLPYTDAYLIGIKDLSVNTTNYSKEETLEIINLLKENKKEIFISLNKNMHNKDLESLKEIMIWLEDKNINGIFYYDIALVQIKQNLKLKTPLVWSQEHLTTNACSANFWQQEGVDYMYVSAEITKDEIIEIKNGTKMKLMVPMFGYIPMFASRRHLIKNYLEKFSLKDNSNYYFLQKEGKDYPIIDNENGTFVYSGNILNGIYEYSLLKDNTIDYATLNGFLIDNDLFTNITKKFKTIDKENNKEYEEYIDSLFSNIDRGFLYKETIYKVKKNG